MSLKSNQSMHIVAMNNRNVVAGWVKICVGSTRLFFHGELLLNTGKLLLSIVELLLFFHRLPVGGVSSPSRRRWARPRWGNNSRHISTFGPAQTWPCSLADIEFISRYVPGCYSSIRLHYNYLRTYYVPRLGCHSQLIRKPSYST